MLGSTVTSPSGLCCIRVAKGFTSPRKILHSDPQTGWGPKNLPCQAVGAEGLFNRIAKLVGGISLASLVGGLPVIRLRETEKGRGGRERGGERGEEGEKKEKGKGEREREREGERERACLDQAIAEAINSGISEIRTCKPQYIPSFFLQQMDCGCKSLERHRDHYLRDVAVRVNMRPRHCPVLSAGGRASQRRRHRACRRRERVGTAIIGLLATELKTDARCVLGCSPGLSRAWSRQMCSQLPGAGIPQPLSCSVQPWALVSRREKLGSVELFKIKWFLFHIHERGCKRDSGSLLFILFMHLPPHLSSQKQVTKGPLFSTSSKPAPPRGDFWAITREAAVPTAGCQSRNTVRVRVPAVCTLQEPPEWFPV
ncbi:uncharacterized protein LOC101700076 [Heterocephalus glaber]|uniref:Uncharacterized protein LOC101700076 n=1 Tax=Heterocephalus glaber TaxID=10181 RepID=A0AAX6THP5_HETGA|nr:uncharacterized protein LOC101700076 [Heterocephalus glaber]